MSTAVATTAATAPTPPVPKEGPRGGRGPLGLDVERDEFIRGLYFNHTAVLLRHVLRHNGGDYQRAEDVVQETMLRAWRHADAIDPLNGSVCNWLMRVAGNAVIDAHRARKARPAEVSAEGAGEHVVKDHADRVVTSIAVQRALSRLRPIHREVLVEVYYHGRSQKEVANALGIPVGTVKSRTSNALSALRVALMAGGR